MAVKKLKLKSINIIGIGGIDSLNLKEFNPKMNIICGVNGVGKTTLIECIAHAFTNYYSSVIKRNVNFDKSFIEVSLQTDNDNDVKKTIDVGETKVNGNVYLTGLGEFSKKLFSLKIDRRFDYHEIQSVSKDQLRDSSTISSSSINGISYLDIKNWFLHRYLYAAHNNALKPSQLANFELAKESFSALDGNFSFSRVDVINNEILLNTPTGEIYYEYLSSGFKSIISIIFGIIKEIEYRFKSPELEAKEFDGIILIDEIEQHLHPEWQGKICEVLSKTFPNAQFFITTHSPHVIQTAKHGEVIALEKNTSGLSKREMVEANYYGYQGWTIEEILEDVMGMPDLRTKKYNEIKKCFDDALDHKNKEDAKIAYDELDKMLHPQYPLRPIFKMQLDSLEVQYDNLGE